MTRRPKDIGTAFETLVVNAFRKQGFKDVERLTNTGAQDEGDVILKDLDHIYVLECKAVKAITLADFVDQARVEGANYAKRRGLPGDSVTGLAVIKRRNKGVWDSYVVTDMRTFFDVDDS